MMFFLTLTLKLNTYYLSSDSSSRKLKNNEMYNLTRQSVLEAIRYLNIWHFDQNSLNFKNQK